MLLSFPPPHTHTHTHTTFQHTPRPPPSPTRSCISLICTHRSFISLLFSVPRGLAKCHRLPCLAVVPRCTFLPTIHRWISLLGSAQWLPSASSRICARPNIAARGATLTRVSSSNGKSSLLKTCAITVQMSKSLLHLCKPQIMATDGKPEEPKAPARPPAEC